MHIPPIRPEVLFNIGSFPVTNSILTSWISSLLLCVIALLVGLNYKRLPSGMQHIFEMVYELFENLSKDALGADGPKFVPLAAAFFLFIITANWIGILPFVGSLGFRHGEEFVPLFRGGNADLNTTAALALIAMTVVHVNGVKSSGLKTHLKHFRNPLEIVTEFAKILSFAFRLFGNVFGGEVLLTALYAIVVLITHNATNNLFGLIGGVIAIPFVIFEFFVGFIQAFVFSMLTLSFISLFNRAGHH